MPNYPIWLAKHRLTFLQLSNVWSWIKQYGRLMALGLLLASCGLVFMSPSPTIPMAQLILAQLALLMLAFDEKQISILTVVVFGHLVVFTVPKTLYFFTGAVTHARLVEIHTLYLVTLMIGGGFVLVRAIQSHRGWNHGTPKWKVIELPVAAVFFLCAMWWFFWFFPMPLTFKMLAMRSQGLALVGIFIFDAKGKQWPIYGARALLVLGALIDFGVTATLFVALQLLTVWIFRVGFRKQWNELPAILGFISVLCFCQMIKPQVRSHLWGDPQPTQMAARVSYRVGVLHSAVKNMEHQNHGNAESISKKAIYASILRLNDDSLEKVVNQTPNRVPYWRGQSYSVLKYAFIPHILWREKPSRDLWHRFGATYGYLQKDDRYTSITLNSFAEGYMNYGFLGLSLTSILLGLIVGVIDFGIARLEGAWKWFAFTLFGTILFFPNDAVSTLTGLIVSTGVIFGTYLFCKNWKTQQPSLIRMGCFLLVIILLMV